MLSSIVFPQNWDKWQWWASEYQFNRGARSLLSATFSLLRHKPGGSREVRLCSKRHQSCSIKPSPAHTHVLTQSQLHAVSHSCSMDTHPISTAFVFTLRALTDPPSYHLSSILKQELLAFIRFEQRLAQGASMLFVAFRWTLEVWV